MKLVQYRIEDIELDPDNVRRHGEEDLAAIMASLKQFGQMTPIVVSVRGDRARVIKGNGTLMAATKLGWEEISAVETSLEGDDLRAYAIADNRTSDLSDWDLEKLVAQLDNLEGELLYAAGFDDGYLSELQGIDVDLPDDLDDDDVANPYTAKVKSPIYEPTMEAPPPMSSLVDRERCQELIEQIKAHAQDLTEEQVDFLTAAAYRHLAFDYKSIAEYYSHLPKDSPMRALMQDSALVIIDFQSAIERGFVKLSTTLGGILEGGLTSESE